MIHLSHFFSFFFFNDTATTEIYTLSLHDAPPISPFARVSQSRPSGPCPGNILRNNQLPSPAATTLRQDRKSTRLNSSHSQISYAVFCLKKKKNKTEDQSIQQLYT